MKKIIAIAVVGMFGVMTLGSCKKDYTCECGFTGTTVKASTTIKATKKDAKAACEKNTTGVAGYSCSLK